MPGVSELVLVQRLLVVTVLAGAVGFERERHGRAAGFRTHILVGVGACLVMMTGLYLTEVKAGTVTLDPTRMAAQVISGIGFLGAGTILRFRASVRGLTTAASLWAVGGIGIAVGAGFVWGAVASTLVVVLALFGFSRLDRAMRRDWYRTLIVELPASGDALPEVRKVLSEYEVEIRDFNIQEAQEKGRLRVELHMKLLDKQEEEDILRGVLRVAGANRAYWT